MKFEAEIVSPGSLEEFPFGVWQRISGDYEVVSGAVPGYFNVKAPRLYADGVLLPEVDRPSNVLWVKDNQSSDDVTISLGAALPFRLGSSETGFEVSDPGRQPDIIPIPDPYGLIGYGVRFRISGPSRWFNETDSIESILGSVSDHFAHESWLEYNASSWSPSRYYRDLRVIKLVVTPEPPSSFIGVLGCAAAIVGIRKLKRSDCMADN